MVLAHYGIQQDEVSLTMLCGTDLSGTALDDIAIVARRFKLSAERSHLFKLKELQEAVTNGIPAIVHVDAVSLYQDPDPVPLGHLVVVVQADANIVIHDPAAGAAQEIARETFEAAWQVYRNGAVLIWR